MQTQQKTIVSDDLVEMVRKRADVPRVRSSEVARILEAAREITREHPARSFFSPE